MALLDIDFYSQQINKTVHAQTVLPVADAIPSPPLPLKTLYLLPRFSASAHDINWMCRIKEYVLKYQMAVIIMDGDNSFYVDRPMTNYSKLVGEELVEFTRKILPLSPEKKDTFIGGISMGGYGAWYNGIKYHDVFGKIAMIHPGFDFYELTLEGAPMFPTAFLDAFFGSKENYHATEYDYRNIIKQEKDVMPKLFHCCGTEDPLLSVNEAFYQYLLANDVPVTHCTAPGGHDEVFINRMWDPLFEFLTDQSSGYVMQQNFAHSDTK